jgi:helix-hairpin-helix protein
VDDKKAALILAGLALAGAGVKLALTPSSGRAPGDVVLAADTAPSAGAGLRATAQSAARLARPLAPGDRVDLDLADVTEITRLPRIGPALARRIVDWRAAHGPFGSLERFDSVPGVGPALLAAVRSYVMFSGNLPPPP